MTKRYSRGRVLALLLAMLFLVTALTPIGAVAVSQEDVDELQGQKDELASKTAACQSKIEQLQAEHAAAIEQKAVLDERNDYIKEVLALTERQIQVYTELIESKAKEVEAAKALEEQQLTRYRTRIRAMEEAGGYNLLDIILNSGSLSQLLAAIDDYREIMKSDRALEKQYIAAREAHEQKAAEYEETKAEYEGKKAELQKEKAELEAKIEEATELIASLEEDLEKAKKEYEEAERAEQAAAWAVSNMIAELIAQREAARQNSGQNVAPADGTEGNDTGNTDSGNTDSGNTDTGNADNGNTDSGSGGNGSYYDEPTGGTGSLVWPVPCSNRVSSVYGGRVHPITGVYTMHNGVDIDGFGNDGGAIIASDGGTVITATYNSSYGNYVIIDHGTGMQTLYAHMSGMAVSVGQSVSQGQVIGYLGATGWATGTHCHFEVFVDGNRTDPLGYFGGYVIE